MNKNYSIQQGFSLTEALIAMLLLSVSLLGLLNYYQSLSQGFMRQWQVQQAWSEAHSQLEAYSVAGKGTEPFAKEWEYLITGTSDAQSCKLVTATIQTPTKYQAILRRLVCNLSL
ncbi:prepilin-type N-terminal cleavage/methylation domain-containing protein [Rahnella aquatilis]|uniref:prepilin-type N-terminal cleavage/methylation domain-containing protein n=1 Tax=Rahnella aquatilis TaxID=34038 RepID=UPI000645613C|nr:prepilin-type N-terminal cleavage/methylation domain-containing protein [Rahnella aquatilis]